MIIDDFVNNEFFIGDSLIDVSSMNNSNTISEDKVDLVTSNNYSLYIYIL